MKKDRIFAILGLLLFGLITLYLTLSRTPFSDEAHSWMIAKSFGFFELLSLERYEGHLFIWHTLLMPFAKNDLFYPYPMFILNWAFCLIATGILWFKSPFSNLEKFLISFSFPFVLYFGIIARCYSVGIMFLFLTLSIWDKRLKHPLLISLFLSLTANTSIMEIIMCTPLGILFLTDLFKSKNKKNIILSLAILFVGAFLVLYQLLGAKWGSEDILHKEFIIRVLIFLLMYKSETLLVNITNLLITATTFLVYIFSFIEFKKYKRVFFYFFSITFMLLFLFIAKYQGEWWHYIYFYIALIVSLWIYRAEVKPPLKLKINYIFIFITFLFVLKSFFVHFGYDYLPPEIHIPRSKLMAQIIKSKNLFHDDYKLYGLDFYSESIPGIMPYFKSLTVYNKYGLNRYSKEGFKKQFYPMNEPIDAKTLFLSFDKDKKNIGISSMELVFTKDYTDYFTIEPIYQDDLTGLMIFEMKKNE